MLESGENTQVVVLNFHPCTFWGFLHQHTWEEAGQHTSILAPPTTYVPSSGDGVARTECVWSTLPILVGHIGGVF